MDRLADALPLRAAAGDEAPPDPSRLRDRPGDALGSHSGGLEAGGDMRVPRSRADEIARRERAAPRVEALRVLRENPGGGPHHGGQHPSVPHRDPVAADAPGQQGRGILVRRGHEHVQHRRRAVAAEHGDVGGAGEGDVLQAPGLLPLPVRAPQRMRGGGEPLLQRHLRGQQRGPVARRPSRERRGDIQLHRRHHEGARGLRPLARVVVEHDHDVRPLQTLRAVDRAHPHRVRGAGEVGAAVDRVHRDPQPGQRDRGGVRAGPVRVLTGHGAQRVEGAQALVGGGPGTDPLGQVERVHERGDHLDGGEGDALLAQVAEPVQHRVPPPLVEQPLPRLPVRLRSEVREPGPVRGVVREQVHQLGEGEGVAEVEGDRERGADEASLAGGEDRPALAGGGDAPLGERGDDVLGPTVRADQHGDVGGGGARFAQQLQHPVGYRGRVLRVGELLRDLRHPGLEPPGTVPRLAPPRHRLRGRGGHHALARQLGEHLREHRGDEVEHRLLRAPGVLEVQHLRVPEPGGARIDTLDDPEHEGGVRVAEAVDRLLRVAHPDLGVDQLRQLE